MDNFWKWLLKANARGVLTCSILALVLMTGWWTWKELSPADRGGGVAAGPPPDKTRTGLGLADYYGNTNAIFLPLNPFVVAWNMPSRPYVPRPRPGMPPPEGAPPVVATPRAVPRTPVKPVRRVPGVPVRPAPGMRRPAVAARPAPGARPGAAAQPGAVPARPPMFENITLTYKGILRRTDGTTLALIEDTKANATRFYHEGPSLYGLKVQSIGKDSVDIIGLDGETITAKIKDPLVIKIPLQ